MRILIATTYIYKQEWPEFTRNRTGFGIMVNEIFESISKKADVYLLSQVITNGHGKVLRHTWKDVLSNARIKDWYKGFKYFFGYHQNIKNRVRYFYYALNSGNIRKTIRTIKPDIVHIQGIGVQVKPYIEVCEQEKIPYIVTLHGLIGMDDTVQAAPWDKQMERTFIIEAEKNRIPVTVISTGMKRRIEDHYLGHEGKNITVICNGTQIPYNKKLAEKDSIDLRKEYGLTNEKIIVVTGTVCERKNQIQIVRALKSGKITVPHHVFFCGADASNGEVQNVIDGMGLTERIHILGYLTREKKEQVLQQADLNVTASIDEGFGLSIIEAFQQGVPTVAFADVDAVTALYHEQTMVKVAEKTDTALAAGIEEGLRKQWNKTWIKEYAKGFKIEKIVEKYKKEYKEALSQEKMVVPIAKTIDYIAVQRKLGYRVLSYVGNITENKNQIQLVELMEDLKSEKVIALLLGREMDGGNVRKTVLEKKIQDYVVLAGFCAEMDSIWCNTDFNVLLSKNEGFGLSIIEGYMRGIPSIVNCHMDAYEDIGYKEASVGVQPELDAIDGIHMAMHAIWNKKKIEECGRKHSDAEMSEKYLKVYKKMLTL